MKAKTFAIVLLLLIQGTFLAADQGNAEKVFTEIYDNGSWKNEESQVASGQGSTVENTKIYRFFLQEFLKENDIHSVVDIGCGDWEFSRHINWTGIQYTGIDIVKNVIAQNQVRFPAANIRFIHGDGVNMDLPAADLLIIKDVLTHLPNDMIPKVFSQFKKFKHCLITHNVDLQTLTSPNVDIPVGEFREMDLTKPPFNIDAQKVLLYRSYEHYGLPGPRAKLVLHIKN